MKEKAKQEKENEARKKNSNTQDIIKYSHKQTKQLLGIGSTFIDLSNFQTKTYVHSCIG